ncbi:Fc.00g039560.m01.CDS01 [Cosmosporella sp. VM-42]
MTLTGGMSEFEGIFGIPCAPEMGRGHCVKFIAWLEILQIIDAQFSSQQQAATEGSRCYPPGLYSDSLPILPEVESTFRDSYADKFELMVNLYTSGPRRLFRTEKGYLGTGFREPQVGDRVCVSQEGNVPFILRERYGKMGMISLETLTCMGLWKARS